jgi:hypothetical protein
MSSELRLLSRDPIAVRMGGVQVLLPFKPAAVWCQSLDRLDFLVSTLANEEGRDALTDLIMAGQISRGDLQSEAFRIMEEASGRKWWEAARLLSTSLSPGILGRLVLAGVDPWQRSVGEWCAAVYALCTKNADEKGLLRFDFSLSVPPPGFEDEWDDGDIDPSVAMASMQGLNNKR